MKIQSLDPRTLKQWLHDKSEIALFDVREHGQYGESHLFLATSVPYSRLEYEAARLAPRKSVRLVVYDEDGGELSQRAASSLVNQGYERVHILSGGAKAWEGEGFNLFAGVNLPSKTFGELVEHQCHTPRLSADALAKMIHDLDDFVVLDGRPLSEFKKMSIPTAQCCPNGELAYRIKSHVTNPRTKIVINCAGRTRSIIGAQTLINLGIKNPIYALENGTQGWFLKDYVLDHGKIGEYAEPKIDEELRLAAKALQVKYAIPLVSDDQFSLWAKDPSRSLYLCDVRTKEEFELNSLAGAQHAPGGQLIQATDQFVGVRNSRIVLYDSDGLRAVTVASWLKQMGHDVSVLADGIASKVSLVDGQSNLDHRLKSNILTNEQLREIVENNSAILIDIRESMQFRKAHLPHSKWAIRPRLMDAIAQNDKPIVLISDNPASTYGALLELKNHGLTADVYELQNSIFPNQFQLVASESEPTDSECIDYLFFVHDRHDGNKEAARRYLEWETGLIAQLDDDEINLYSIS
jgi:rhodanese-related sulfurtransferase